MSRGGGAGTRTKERIANGFFTEGGGHIEAAGEAAKTDALLSNWERKKE